MTFLKATAAASALLLTASAATASTILIDDFTASGSVASNQGGNPDTLDVADGGILGGERFMWVSSDDSPDPSFGTTFEASGGALDFANAPATDVRTGTGQAVLVYDGLGDGTAQSFFFNSLPAALVPSADFPDANTASILVDTDGLGGEDFLQGALVSQRGIEFEFASFDEGGILDFRAYAWDTDDNLVTFQETLANPFNSDISFNNILGLDEFSAGPFNWMSVGAIAFSVESLSPEFDGTLLSISVVPLPLSALLLLGGLGGLAGVSAASKRRRKSATA